MRYILFLLPGFLLFSCNKNNRIADPGDYNNFLDGRVREAQVKQVNKEIGFWSDRLQKDTGNWMDMLELSRQQFGLFRLTGDIAALRAGDSLLKRSSAKLNDTDPELIIPLSQNSITHHRFREAAFYNEEAERKEGDKYTIRLLQFDTRMELGLYADAYKSLEAVKDRSSFDYLIRLAKWEDHNGRLDAAINLMEQALEKVKDKNRSLHSWALSNLGDMYGHAGKIRESYQAYLDVLKIDPANLYCLKGIAWIVFSHDGDKGEAKRILQYILSQAEMPDLKLLLAEIAEMANKPVEKQRWIDEFLQDVTQPGYGDMYNKYLIGIYAENKKEHEKALQLAEKELSNRFTPETCDWMAWVQYQQGNYSKAYVLSRNYVYNKTFEPEALMHTAFIFSVNGKKEEAKQLLKECLESAYELGPVATQQIKEKLASF